LGCSLTLKYIPLNIKIYNIESYPCSGGKFIRSPGNWAKILEKNNKRAIIVFKNGKKKSFSLYCCATIGRVSNLQSKKS
jgi:large subunit ribosomal protein L2